MKVTVQLFGAFRPFGDALDVQLPEKAVVADIRGTLVDRLQAMDAKIMVKGLVESSRFATDTEILAESRALETGMVVAIIPPVAGG